MLEIFLFFFCIRLFPNLTIELNNVTEIVFNIYLGRKKRIRYNKMYIQKHKLGDGVLTVRIVQVPLKLQPFLVTFKDMNSLMVKYMISTPLSIENPVRSPIVPPMRLIWASMVNFLSRSISSQVAGTKQNWTRCKGGYSFGETETEQFLIRANQTNPTQEGLY